MYRRSYLESSGINPIKNLICTFLSILCEIRFLIYLLKGETNESVSRKKSCKLS